MIRLIFIKVSLACFATWLFVYQPSIVVPVFFSSLVVFLVVFINGERISVISARKVGLFHASKGNALAVSGSYIVPGRITELLKPAYFKIQCDLPLSQGVSVVLAERVFDVLALLLLILFAIVLLPPVEDLNLAVSGDLLLLGVLALLFFVVFFAYRAQYLLAAFSWVPQSRIKEFVNNYIADFECAFKEGLSSYQVALSFLVWVGSGFSYWVFLNLDGGPAVTLGGALLVFIVGTIGLTVTFTPGGIGTFEAAVALTLTFFGYNAEQSIVSAFGLRLAGTLPTVTVALYTLATGGVDLLTRLREQASRGN